MNKPSSLKPKPKATLKDLKPKAGVRGGGQSSPMSSSPMASSPMGSSPLSS